MTRTAVMVMRMVLRAVMVMRMVLRAVMVMRAAMVVKMTPATMPFLIFPFERTLPLVSGKNIHHGVRRRAHVRKISPHHQFRRRTEERFTCCRTVFPSLSRRVRRRATSQPHETPDRPGNRQ